MINNMEYSTNENIIKMQTKLLDTTIRYLHTHSPYYKFIFDQEIDASSIKSLDDLQKLPVITKSELLKYNYDFFSCHISSASDIVTTSGSTGLQPIIHPLTKTDLQRLAYNEELSFLIADITSNDNVMLSTALDGSFVAGLAYYLGIKRIGAGIVRAGSKNLNIQKEILRLFPITTIIGVPSNLIKLHNYCCLEKNSIEKSKISKLILIGESIRNKDYSLNQLGKRLSECYPQAGLYSTYANTETCTSFCECSAGNGGHLHPNLAYIEILDEKGQRVPEGVEGRLVITTFGCNGMPLLRYDTGDITFMVSEKCSCGRSTQRIGPILGRAKNILKISGVTFSQMQLENAILSVQYVDDYCVTIQMKDAIQYIIVYFTSQEVVHEQMIQEIKQKIWESLRITTEVKYCNVNELNKIQNSTESRKPLKLINLSNEIAN